MGNPAAVPARFIISAAKPEQFPSEYAEAGAGDHVPDLKSQDMEVAFLGRSNVGKSSLINRLLGVEGIARTSARPGCTQTINFYQVNGGYRFVDLPGYGYAKVPPEITREWKALIESYLVGRRTLGLAFIVLDARRGWMEKDLELRDWLRAYGRSYQVIATKTDKLTNQREKQQSRNALASAGEGILECSAETGRGVREIWQAISKIKTSL
jgi:GTP-binding protein